MVLYINVKTKHLALDFDFQSYLFGILDLLHEHHFDIFKNDDVVLKVVDSRNLRMIIPSNNFFLLSRKDNYRLLSAGLERCTMTLHDLNRQFYPDGPDFRNSVDFIFSPDFQNPLFRKKCQSKYIQAYNSKGLSFLDEYVEEPSRFIYLLLTNLFDDIKRINNIYTDL